MNNLQSVRTAIKAKGEPKYKIIGDKVLINLGKDSKGQTKYKQLGIQHIGPKGILCNDLETLIPLDDLI